MPSNLSGLDAFAQEFDQACRKAMQKAAEDAEEFMKQAHPQYQDDSGSLTASITGFEAKIGDPLKNQHDAAWTAARVTGYVSPRHKNTWDNFTLITDDKEFGQDDHPVAIVTAYTHYAPDVAWEVFQEGLGILEGRVFTRLNEELGSLFGKSALIGRSTTRNQFSDVDLEGILRQGNIN